MAAVTAFLAGSAMAMASSQMPPLSIVPKPMQAERKSGEFVLSEKTRFVASGEATAVAETLAQSLRTPTGLPLSVHAVIGGPSVISLEIDESLSSLGEEGYRLEVTPQRVSIRSAGAAGLFYGGQTLRQLLPEQAFALDEQAGVRWAMPAAVIEDKPRFEWRGLMLDTARHFMPKEFIFRFIDLLAIHKMNRFHWHLTEDQGWRLEIKKYPKLTEVGAWRDQTIVGHGGRPRAEWEFDGQRHGGYYTQDDVREIVAYAQERFVTVVPEIEMPGHAQAAIAAYPELGNTGQQLKVLEYWGVNPNIFNVRESTILFLQDVLTEVLDLFPSEFIHIGGDEAPKTQWEQSPEAQARIKELGLHDEHELQSWFIKRMDTFLESKGRRLIGWDEILEGGLAPGATVMSWRGTAGGVTAAKAGHDVVMAPTSHFYLDYYQSRDRTKEPLAIGGFVPLSQVYSFNPTIPELTAEEAKHVLGAQGNLWTEYMKTPEHVEYMAFPRACAVSEVVWTQQDLREYDEFLQRLPFHLDRLGQMGVNFRPLDAGVGGKEIGNWKAGAVTEDYAVATWDLTPHLSGVGKYDLLFDYTSGAHRLEIAWIEVVQGGRVLARIEQHGITGAFDENNVYRLDLAKLGSGAVTLRASVKSDGGTDSNGVILLSKV